MIDIQGINHITMKVSYLKRAAEFYLAILGAKIVHKGNTDIYLDIGGVWLCLLEKENAKPIQKDQIGVDHIAFTVSEETFNTAVEVLSENNIPFTRGPVQRGGGWTVSFKDPDGNELEFYTGSLYDRMKNWK
jgi:catechol-2,3-dioxygenase